MELLGFGGADGREDSDGSDEGGEGSKRRRRRDGGEQKENDGSPHEREAKRRRPGAEDGVDDDGVWGAMGGDDVDDLDAEDRIVRVRGLSGACVCVWARMPAFCVRERASAASPHAPAPAPSSARVHALPHCGEHGGVAARKPTAVTNL